MQIYQFNLQFNPEQDRLIFRLNTTSGDEFRFCLTRRFVKLLWPVLQQLLEKDYLRREPDKAHIAGELLAFEHEKVIADANFQEKYSDEAKNFPLGDDIILLTRIQVKSSGQGDVLCLLPTTGQGLEFQAHNRFLHTFCKLLKDVTLRAEWDLSLTEAVGENLPGPAAGRTVH